VRAGLGRGLTARRGEPEAVAQADLVCTCTTSETPLFHGSMLAPGAHVNAIGSFRPETREVDPETVRRSRVVVETREAALAEAGDLLLPIEEGVVQAGHIVADLGEVVRGASVRRSPEDITLFKSVGIAFEDLVVARAILDAGR
jgi:ornithine cyclodeaminase